MSDRVAVVTGAGRGMGREVAQRLVARGLTVVVTDVDETAVRRTAADLGDKCVPVHHDVRDAVAHREVAARAFAPAVEACRIVPGALRGLAGVYGAAKAFMDQREAGII